MGLMNKLFPGTDTVEDKDNDLYDEIDDTDDEDTPEEKTVKKSSLRGDLSEKGGRKMKPDYHSLRGRRAAATPDPADLDEDFSFFDDEDSDDEEDKEGNTPAARRWFHAPGNLSDEDDEDDEDDDDEGEGPAPVFSRPTPTPSADEPTNLDLLHTIAEKVEAQEVVLGNLSTTLSVILDALNKLLSKPTPSTDATANLGSVLTELKKLPAETAKQIPKPDFSLLLRAVEELTNVVGSLPTPAPAPAAASALEEAIDRDLDVQAFKKEIEGFEFYQVYDLNGQPKTPAEVAQFFGSADPKTHGLKKRVGKFEKGKFIAWSDERHLRAYELLTPKPVTPFKGKVELL